MITFDPAKHKYTDKEGKEYISVTTLLSKRFPFNGPAIAKQLITNQNSKYYKWTVKQVLKEWRDSAGHGNDVHNAVELYLKEHTMPDDDVLYPLVEQFKKLRFTGKILSEERVWDEELLIAGTADIIEDCDDYCWLFDIKTSAKVGDDKLHKFSMQLEIYKRLIEKRFNKPCKIGGILWFEDYVNQKEKTVLKVLKTLDCSIEVDQILAERKSEINS